ncbi:pyrroloquinoline quinone biosynthesis protein PqqE [Peptostreptococcus russellii]|uniref:Pyrroloquinoline quinone biosynthesis protein PqqE n=1 Tax=Peptostreptococcus russellii TaxID=215200 RepID=A0A2P7PZZ9_9FIRM|nr:radical SAM protein [Peptostreptococcus russellii]PSJ31275.1 pyrroloquinoline quinone biosynthesis protein PqqE [Peptostreptococcus russellii]
MGIAHKVERKIAAKGIEKVVESVKKKDTEGREKAMLSLVDIYQKHAGDMFAEETYDIVREMIKDRDGKWINYVYDMMDNLDTNVIKMTALNLGFTGAYYGKKIINEKRVEHGCNVPWLILMDPTSACNMKCKGCWAAEYGHNQSLSFEELDDIIQQGKKLGIYFYMYTGGEPLMRKNDLIKLCEKHRDCYFVAFTNGTLIDDDFAKEMVRVGNFSVTLSVEGFEEENDGRRGEGSFDNVMKAMDILREHGLIFGTSICYTSKNIETVLSDKFLDLIIEKGAMYSWYFNYMPVGNGAVPELIPTVKQREYIYHRVREIRAFEGGKPIMLLDFQNDGEYVGGCIAGGRNYLHINSAGDVEPCVFIHYSNSNIRENTLLECLKSPIFMAYKEGQPFNDNHLRPCPMLENPELLNEMVKRTGAHSTDLISPEKVDSLTSKCMPYANEWKEKANELWEHSQEEKAKRKSI